MPDIHYTNVSVVKSHKDYEPILAIFIQYFARIPTLLLPMMCFPIYIRTIPSNKTLCSHSNFKGLWNKSFNNNHHMNTTLYSCQNMIENRDIIETSLRHTKSRYIMYMNVETIISDASGWSAHTAWNNHHCFNHPLSLTLVLRYLFLPNT